MAYAYGTDGKVWRDPSTGNPTPRGDDRTPCDSCEKPPTWAKKAGLGFRELRELAKPFDFSEANRLAYRFYQQCAAIGEFPNDPLVRWYAGVIREIETEWQRQPAEQSFQAVKFLCELLAKGR